MLEWIFKCAEPLLSVIEAGPCLIYIKGLPNENHVI